MKSLIAAFVLSALATGAVAQSRPSTLQMSCGQARATVASRGAIVLGTGGYTYDRFVGNRNFCEINETIEPAWVPTRDTPQCFIGYRCRDRDYMFWDD
jgi:hypothetical protein